MIDSKIVGWTANTEHRVEHLYKPQTNWDKLPVKFAKLSNIYDINLDELKQTLSSITDNYNLQPIIVNPKTLKKRLTYRGIGLTRRQNTENPIYEAAEYFNSAGEFISSAKSLGQSGLSFPDSKKSEFEREFNTANSVAFDFTTNLQKKFKKWTPTKIRIMELHPSGFVPPHYDHPYYNQIRIHSVINTNDDVFWEVEGQQFKIPSDGSFYWFDTGRIHSVYNFGKTVRTVLSVHLCPALNSNGEPQIDNLLEDFQTGSL